MKSLISKRNLPSDRIVRLIAKGILILLLSCISLGPLIWMISSSLKSTGEMFVNRWGLPWEWRWDNYSTVWVEAHIAEYFFNSVIITITSVVLMIICGSMAAYGLVRFHPKHKCMRGLFFYFLTGQMIPAQVVVVTVFLLVWSMKGLNSRIMISIVYAASGLPFVILLLRGFFSTVQKDLFDAALIDGCNELGIFSRVLLPLCRPVLASVVIFQFIYVWNEFVLALVLLRHPGKYTLPLGVFMASMDRYVTDYGLAFAAITITCIPVIVVFLIFQKQFVRGIAAGAFKG